MKPWKAALSSFCLIMSACAAEKPKNFAPASVDCGYQASELRELCSLVNEKRRELGLAPLATDDTLVDSAQSHADDMARRNYFSHDTPEGVSFDVRMRRAGASFRSAAENIAYGQPDAREVLDAWLSSPGHRLNLLNPNFGRFGLGFAKGRWVQNFAD